MPAVYACWETGNKFRGEVEVDQRRDGVTVNGIEADETVLLQISVWVGGQFPSIHVIQIMNSSTVIGYFTFPIRRLLGGIRNSLH